MGKVVEFPEAQPVAARTEKISEWVCPLCRQEMILSEFKSKRGFLLVCKGADNVPHRLRIYLENFSKDASFLPSSPSSKKERVQQLLNRVKAGAG
jgi:ssDNA-binding Zn-finger/Zn-ribbon topoisomerase 1